MVRRALGRVLVGSAGTVAGLRIAGPCRRRVGPFDTAARAGLAPSGGVRVDVPPLGSARIPLFRGPLRLGVTITGLDLDRSQKIVQGADPRATARALVPELRALALRTAGTCAAAAIGGAALVGAAAFRNRADAAATAGVATAWLALGAAVAAATRRPVGWDDVELDGLLAKAPSVLGDARQIPGNFERYRDQLVELLDTGAAVFRAVVDLPDGPPRDAIRVVHVSDIHLSPFAFPLARAVVEQYRADAVVDTGDLTDWGTPPEQALADKIPSLGVPYVYVKGNHDSAGIANAVARQSNAVVLDADTGTSTVAGLRFVGTGDPRFTPDKTTGDDHHTGRVRTAGRRFASELRKNGTQADVALVHAPATGRALAGLVPIVLAGDIHRRTAREDDGTVTLVQGSTGGSGLRGVQIDPPAPVNLSVLFFDRPTKRLWGADEITMDGLGGTGVSIVRRPLADLLAGDGRSRVAAKGHQ